MLLVSGCNFAHLAQSGGAAGAGALVTSLVTSNPAYIAGGAAVSAVTVEVLDPLNTDDGSYDTGFEEGYEDGISEIPEVAITKSIAHVFETLGMWIIIGSVILVIVAWLIPGPQHIFKRKKKSLNNSDLFK